MVGLNPLVTGGDNLLSEIGLEVEGNMGDQLGSLKTEKNSRSGIAVLQSDVADSMSILRAGPPQPCKESSCVDPPLPFADLPFADTQEVYPPDLRTSR